MTMPSGSRSSARRRWSSCCSRASARTIIHCHDWQTALVPVLLYELYQPIGMGDQRVCFTVHNFSHQGIADESLLWATGLCDPARFFDYERLRDNFNPAALNLMKGGIVYSNFVTTVSPGHAWEVCYSDQGRGLGHTLHVHRGKFGGVLNGVDYDMWNPEIDPLDRAALRAATRSTDKYANKHALRERFMLRTTTSRSSPTSAGSTARRACT